MTEATAVETGAEHRSQWPIIAAAGAAVLYVGFGIYGLSHATEYLPALLGGVTTLAGAGLLSVGLFGWLWEAFLDGQSQRTEHDHESATLYGATMVMFLLTDVMTFSAGFVYYFAIRGGAWPPQHLPEGLLGALVLVNTAVLLTSSGTFHLASSALEDGNVTRFNRLMTVTLLLGLVFLGGQAYEYYEFLNEGFSLSTGVFSNAFYGLTGLHGLHVTLGVILIAMVAIRGYRGHYGPERDTSVETVEFYWHFVDVIWVFLVLVLYVGAIVGAG